MKRFLSVFLSAALLLSLLAGCGGGDTPADGGSADAGASSDAGGSTGGGHKSDLIIGTAADINNLNLQEQQDAVNNIILKTTHENLVRFTNEGTCVPCIATEWEYLDDTHIQFKLVENAHFSTGEPLTAEDVKFTYDMAKDSYVASVLSNVVSTEVVDDYTVVLELGKYDNELLPSLASVPVAIQSKAAYDSGMENPWYVGSGRYKFDDWVEGQFCRVVKVDDYWGEDPGTAESIEFRPYLEASSRVIALQNGEIDVCIDPPINELQYLEEDPNITVEEKTGSRLFYFAFNVEKAPWDNQKLRQAVACAIDRDAVLQAAVYGKGTPQTTILNRGLWGFYDDMEGFDYDVDRAKSLMAEAGYANGGISTKLLIANSAPYTNIAQVIQANLKTIGIEVEIQTVEDATLKTMCKNGEQEIYLWRWNEDSKVDFVYRDLYYTGSGSNYHHYSDPHVDELVDIVNTEKDEQKRMDAGIELQEYLVDACPQVPLYIANLVIAYNKNLTGTMLFPGGNHDWSHAYIAQ